MSKEEDEVDDKRIDQREEIATAQMKLIQSEENNGKSTVQQRQQQQFTH